MANNLNYGHDPMAYYRWFFNPFTTEEIDKYVFRRSKGELGFKIVRIRYNDKANSYLTDYIVEIDEDGNSYYINHGEDAGHE